MTDEPHVNKEQQDEFRPVSGEYKGRTFMGGMALAARSSLFTLAGFAMLGAGGFGLHFADKELEKADTALMQSVSLNTVTAGIERDIWRIRAEAKHLPKGAGAAEVAANQEHLALANSVGLRLDALYKNAGAEAMSEQVSTLREAIAQYVEQHQESSAENTRTPKDLTPWEAGVRLAMHDIGKTLAGGNIFSLDESLRSVRAATTAFIESGAKADLATAQEQQKEFTRLLASVPLNEDVKTTLEANLDEYRLALAAYAKLRLVRDDSRQRLDEIVSYMTPSIDAITGFAGDSLAQAGAQRRDLRQRYRILIACGVAGAVLSLLLLGLIILRSVTAPIASAAKAARILSAGDSQIAVRGMANEDETGDIARAFWALKERLAEANKLRETMKKAKAEAERGHAATAEAEWLRRDLESMKTEADKGREAIAEVALLRKIIDATADTVGQNQMREDTARSKSQAPENPPALTFDSISSISRKVAESSETVTAAADEAEKTGALIRNLSDAADKINSIENLIVDIGEQADMLVINTPSQGPETNLVVLSGNDDGGRPDNIARRFDAIRSAAGQVTWAVRDISILIRESRDVALDIARLSSAEALEVTTDLLQQSENLRGMLDNLVHKMQDQIVEGEAEALSTKDGDGPSIA